MWSPASSLWGRLLNYEADRRYVADTNPSLASSPVVIAMWEPLARALGWPRKPIGFADVLELATTQSSWAAYGKPTFGRFKLGHTNPDFSTSGLSFVAAQYYAAAGKREGLTEADVRRPAIRLKVRAIEHSIVHYGDTGSFFAEQLSAKGPGYASAVAMEETTLLDFNKARPPGAMKLVAIYPAEGTFVSDNPYLVLRAPWVTATQRRAAAAFGAWLRARLTPGLVARFGYRPGDPGKPPVPPLTRANGVDPSQPERLLSLPQPRVLARIKTAWREDRKAANVLLVVDVSGSMAEEDKIGQARQGLAAFLAQLSPRDRVGLVTFDSTTRTIVSPASFAQNRRVLSERVSELVAGGGTALYDATLQGWQTVDGLNDDERINAEVVLSDGADNSSASKLESLLDRLRSRGSGEGRQIRIFTIAYGSDANRDVLAKIAEASGGKAYAGDPQTIQSVYLQISSFF
jgi:Ca-activated chloride channel family protein